MPTPFDTAPKPASKADGPSERSVNYLRDLMMEKAYLTEDDHAAAVDRIDAWLTKPGRTQREVSNSIDRLKDEGFTGRYQGPVFDLEDGYYEHPDVATPIRLIHAIHGTGNQYARAFDPETCKWNVQIPGLMRMLKADGVRIDTDMERAAELGKLYGYCMVCGTKLTDKNPGGSIERGYGPTCAKRMGWPHG
jgi:hypothetical protein